MSRSRRIRTLAVLLPLAALVCWPLPPGWSEEAEAPAPTGIAALTWLAGTWTSDNFETVYTSPRGGEIVSASKFLQGERAVFFDYERFRTQGSDVILTPFPGGKKSVDFALHGFDPKKKRARFVNEAHDFPQSLTYERTGERTLRITLVGEENGTPKKMVLELKRP